MAEGTVDSKSDGDDSGDDHDGRDVHDVTIVLVVVVVVVAVVPGARQPSVVVHSERAPRYPFAGRKGRRMSPLENTSQLPKESRSRARDERRSKQLVATTSIALSRTTCLGVRSWRLGFDHPSLSTRAGSMTDARRAGNAPAIAPMATSTAAAPKSVVRSRAGTRKSSVETYGDAQ